MLLSAVWHGLELDICDGWVQRVCHVVCSEFVRCWNTKKSQSNCFGRTAVEPRRRVQTPRSINPKRISSWGSTSWVGADAISQRSRFLGDIPVVKPTADASDSRQGCLSELGRRGLGGKQGWNRTFHGKRGSFGARHAMLVAKIIMLGSSGCKTGCWDGTEPLGRAVQKSEEHLISHLVHRVMRDERRHPRVVAYRGNTVQPVVDEETGAVDKAPPLSGV